MKGKKKKDTENNEANPAWKIFVSYTEVSTIQGLMYIFLPYQVTILNIYNNTFYEI